MQATNLTSRAARWSAKHRRIAILGWIAFVVLSLAVGSAVGTKTIADAGFPDEASEQVLIQAQGDLTVTDRAFTRAVHDVENRLSQVPHVAEIKSPLKPQNAGLNSHSCGSFYACHSSDRIISHFRTRDSKLLSNAIALRICSRITSKSSRV